MCAHRPIGKHGTMQNSQRMKSEEAPFHSGKQVTAQHRERDKGGVSAQAKAGQSTRAARKRTAAAPLSVAPFSQPSLTPVPSITPDARQVCQNALVKQMLHLPEDRGTALDFVYDGSLTPLQEHLASKFGHTEATDAAGQGHVLAIEPSGASHIAALLQ